MPNFRSRRANESMFTESGRVRRKAGKTRPVSRLSSGPIWDFLIAMEREPLRTPMLQSHGHSGQDGEDS